MGDSPSDNSLGSDGSHARVIRWLVSMAVLAVLGSIAYSAANSAGWVSHDKTVDIYMKGDWLVGENRVCSGIQARQPDDTYLMSALFCPGDAPAEQGHNLSVTFWGKISRPDAVNAGRLLTWKCTRNGVGFTCKALD